MKRLSILLLVASAALLSCKKDKEDNDLVLSGTYTGTFVRYGPVIDGLVAKVTLKFDGNTFSGQSDRDFYPAICSGKFSVNGNKANFENTCVWPAHFDWTLILSGEYDIRIEGDTLFITRSYGTTAPLQDSYILIRQ